jgi:hypothetical protein
MIRDGAPRSWTSLMRDVAKEIADDARDPDDDHPLTEGRWPWSSLHVEGYRDRDGQWRDGLVEICGASPRAISDALTELGRAGYEMRQPITDAAGKPVTDKRGRLVFAAKGHALGLWVPRLPPRPEPQSTHERATFEADSSHRSATNEAESWVADALPTADSSHSGASTDSQRSHPDASKVAPECDPIPSGSPQEKPSPQTVVSLSATSVEVAHAREVKIEMDDPAEFEDHRQRTMEAFSAWMAEHPEAS